MTLLGRIDVSAHVQQCDLLDGPRADRPRQTGRPPYVQPGDPPVVHDLIRRRSHRIDGAGAEDRADLVLDCAVGGLGMVSEVRQHTHGFVDRHT
jgi:hypothetical protein